jgi:ATP-binding cassette subfamily B protein
MVEFNSNRHRVSTAPPSEGAGGFANDGAVQIGPLPSQHEMKGLRSPFGARSEQWSILSYYVTVLQRILLGARLALFLLASAMHAAGHGLVALVAGALTATLSQRGLPLARLGLPRVWESEGGDHLADRAFYWSLVGLGVVLVKSTAGVYATYVQGRVAGEVGAQLRLELLDALLAVHRLRRPRHDDQGPEGPSPMAQGVAALTDRVHEMELGLRNGLLGGVRAVAQLVPLGVVLAMLSARTAAAAALVLGTFGALLGKVRSGYRRAAMRAACERTKLLEAADESVRHAELWVSYGAEEKARSGLRALGNALASGGARLDAGAAALTGANEVLGAGALAVAIGASRAGWLGPVADGSTLLAFAVAFFLAYRPIREFADARLAVARATSAYGELRRLVGEPRGQMPGRSEDAPGADATRAWPLAPLELRELRLVRGGCGPLSLRIEPGAILAIQGATGVGKTTLLRTLLGFEPALGGQLLYDGLAIGDMAAGPASRPFAWVPQDAPLLADTLATNVALGALGHEACDALDPIGARHLVGTLLGARLGAGGRAVSGGERQWIALARAIATGQPVLLLDEPTSGLDADAQRRVLEAVARLRGRRTVLLVTHRLEPLAIADVVIRLDARGALSDAA